LLEEESLLQSLFVWNCQRQSCNAFIGLSIRVRKWLVRTSPSTWTFGGFPFPCKTPIFSLFSLVAPQP